MQIMVCISKEKKVNEKIKSFLYGFGSAIIAVITFGLCRGSFDRSGIRNSITTVRRSRRSVEQVRESVDNASGASENIADAVTTGVNILDGLTDAVTTSNEMVTEIGVGIEGTQGDITTAANGIRTARDILERAKQRTDNQKYN